jgi:hypothetical protein
MGLRTGHRSGNQAGIRDGGTSTLPILFEFAYPLPICGRTRPVNVALFDLEASSASQTDL